VVVAIAGTAVFRPTMLALATLGAVVAVVMLALLEAMVVTTRAVCKCILPPLHLRCIA
jgi:hypothetical protein